MSGYFLCQRPKLTAVSAELDVFMNDLTVESIDRAIACFQDGIKSCAALPSDFDPRRAQLACSQIYRLTEKGSTAMTSMYDIPKFWINLNGLVQNSNLNAMECCITRVFCMQGALIFHRWLSDVVPAAVNRLSRNTWLEKLAFDVRNAIEQKKEAIFNSTNYLPNLAFPRVYSLTPPNFQYERTELIISVVSSIVRLWLHFPSDEYSLLQLSLIDIVTSKSPSSVLFLDKIWDMYKSPFSTFFSKWNKKTSKTRMKVSLAYFEE